ncbi:Pex19-domain-containing protein [Stipitochalara longipes BDJ]|nr:Pex19-domain-containing protein [Stipitochalara longipes BDJ]
MESKPGDLEGLAETSGKAIEKETTAVPTPKDPASAALPKPNNPVPTEEVPDPDEDDLDDLDDMLDEFTPSPSTAKPTLPTGPGRPSAPIPDLPTEEGISDEDFAKQLQSGMAELLGELETSPDMQAQFENMLKELGGAAALGEAAGLGGPGPTASTSKGPTTKPVPTAVKAGPAAAAPATEESFQETIKKTMERMRDSGDQATAAATSDNTDDLLAEMMKAMGAGGLDGEGGEEDFSKMLLGMMEQLTNKEILYEPMKELDDKFPDWMKKNAGKVDEADMKRYKEQQIFVREIVKRFELKTYTDDNAADREYIVDRMQKMQAAGSPPADLVGDMAAAQEAFGAPEEGCPTQ